MRTCRGPDCQRPARAKGLCYAHYRQAWKGKPLTPIRAFDPDDAARFASLTRTEGACQVWAGAYDGATPVFVVNLRTRPARRWAWERHHGPTQGKVSVTCGNLQCVALAHLSAEREDLCDRMKATAARGVDIPNHKLTEDDVRDVRAQHRAGWTFTEIAKGLGVSRTCISNAVNRRTWRHVTG